MSNNEPYVEKCQVDYTSPLLPHPPPRTSLGVRAWGWGGGRLTASAAAARRIYWPNSPCERYDSARRCRFGCRHLVLPGGIGGRAPALLPSATVTPLFPPLEDPAPLTALLASISAWSAVFYLSVLRIPKIRRKALTTRRSSFRRIPTISVRSGPHARSRSRCCGSPRRWSGSLTTQRSLAAARSRPH